MGGWNGRKVAKARAFVAETLPTVCPKCRTMINETDEWDVGHIIPRDVAPDLEDDPSNWQAEHSYCNRSAGAKYLAEKRAGGRRFRSTSRKWGVPK